MAREKRIEAGDMGSAPANRLGSEPEAGVFRSSNVGAGLESEETDADILCAGESASDCDDLELAI